MKIIDTHAHLDHLQNLEEALATAHLQGVEGIVAVSEDYASSRKNLEIKRKYPNPNIYVAAGMHPSETNLANLDRCKEFIDENISELSAIGEIGLDYWYQGVKKDEKLKVQQREAFEWFLKIAKDCQLPVVIHSRGAWSDCLDIVQRVGIARAVFHWYSGPIEVLDDILKAGYYVSATPSLESSPQAQEAIKHAPIEKILIETDTPVYYRNKETKQGFSAQPKDVYKTLKLYCNLKGLKEEICVEVFNANAKEFFSMSSQG